MTDLVNHELFPLKSASLHNSARNATLAGARISITADGMTLDDISLFRHTTITACNSPLIACCHEWHGMDVTRRRLSQSLFRLHFFCKYLIAMFVLYIGYSFLPIGPTVPYKLPSSSFCTAC